MAKKQGSHEIPPAAEATPDGIAVHCKYDQLVLASELKLYPGNYRKHKAKQIDRMHTVIVGKTKGKGNGWRRCAVVSKLSGLVIKGNGMVQMAQRHGLHVPVEFQSYASRREEIRDLIADNRLAELAEDDADALKKLLSELDASEIEFAAVTTAEIEALLADDEISEAEFPITAKLHESYDYVLVFCDNESDFMFLQTLCGVETERSYKKTGIGLGRAIPFQRFLSAIRENHHSIHVQGGDNDNAPAHTGRVDRRARKPTKAVR